MLIYMYVYRPILYYIIFIGARALPVAISLTCMKAAKELTDHAAGNGLGVTRELVAHQVVGT